MLVAQGELRRQQPSQTHPVSFDDYIQRRLHPAGSQWIGEADHNDREGQRCALRGRVPTGPFAMITSTLFLNQVFRELRYPTIIAVVGRHTITTSPPSVFPTSGYPLSLRLLWIVEHHSCRLDLPGI